MYDRNNDMIADVNGKVIDASSHSELAIPNAFAKAFSELATPIRVEEFLADRYSPEPTVGAMVNMAYDRDIILLGVHAVAKEAWRHHNEVSDAELVIHGDVAWFAQLTKLVEHMGYVARMDEDFRRIVTLAVVWGCLTLQGVNEAPFMQPEAAAR